ncbi:MAG: serine/threonine protein kinase [Myxococcaceae bacterium]|nr:MAG: serine/threonine protein kinase [Myxococcaceae bacterium]
MAVDVDVEALVARAEIDQAAALAVNRKQWRRAAELLSSLGRVADAAVAAAEGDEWRLAMDIALQASDEQVLDALCARLGSDPARVAQAAGQARLARRDDVAARLLEETRPLEAAETWYARGEYARAAPCFERAGDPGRAARAWEQHLAQSPDDAAAALRLGELRARQGDDEGAVRAFQAAAKVEASDEVMARLAAGMRRLGYLHAARYWIARLRDRDASWPVDPEAYDPYLPRAEGAAKRYAGRYRVVREAGSGATGRVLEAVDELTGDSVALKVLTVSDDRSAAFGRFVREAELARTLDDPCLVRMRALDPEGPTIVYDWMPGGTLSAKVGSMPLREVGRVALRLLHALETLHRHGVVHRDVKPSNVLFDAAGQARLGDLGAAHLGDLGATVTGGLVGSLPYMAPEQMTGAPVSASTDLYALGCVIFEMLTGQAPYGGPDYMAQHLGEAVPKVTELCPRLPEVFDEAIEKLMAKSQDDRPQDATEARALLSSLPWDLADELVLERPVPRNDRRSSVPPPPMDRDESQRVRTAAGWEDAFTGAKLARVTTFRGARERVLSWARSNAPELQTVLDLDEGPAEDVWWLSAVQATRPMREVPPLARERALRALEAVGVSPLVAVDLTVAWDGDDAVVPLAAALSVMGVHAAAE